jgi:hypothetical protein
MAGQETNPFDNPYASPAHEAVERRPSAIPEIAAPDDAIDGPDAIRLAGNVTPEIAAEALKLYERRSGSSTASFVVIALLGGAIVFLVLHEPAVAVFLFYFLVFSVVLVTRHLVTKRSRKALRQGPFSGCASSRGIELNYGDETIRLGWAFITGRLTDGRILLLYAYPASCLVLPRAAFVSQDDWDRLDDWMERRNVNHVGRGTI